MLVIIDAGHGWQTSGKESSDGRLKEYKYCREIAARVVSQLNKEGIKALDLMAGNDNDESLSSRCRRINELSNNEMCIVVSIHCNASGLTREWRQANGWQVCISLNASNKSKTLANKLFNAAESLGLKMRKPKPDQKYWEQNLAICRDTHCPAILTENLFMDNKQDCDFLLSEKGKQTIVDLHVKGIKSFLLD